MPKTCYVFIAIVACWFTLSYAEPVPIRVGSVAYGTLAWELAALQHENLPQQTDFSLSTHTFATPQAAQIALQSGAVDVIVSDWIWVARQRQSGAPWTFYPYSELHGALLVPMDSPIKTLADLKQCKLGIAGGELDKNWLLLQTLLKQQGLAASSSTIEPVYGAPPLLSQQLRQKRLDALLTYWHHAVPLQSEGYRVLIDGAGLLRALGIDDPPPSLGYVFSATWAASHRAALQAFFAATRQAKNRLCEDDAAWQRIAPLTQHQQPKILALLRERYCAGRVAHWGTPQRDAAARLYGLLRQHGGVRLTGEAPVLAPGTFWDAANE